MNIVREEVRLLLTSDGRLSSLLAINLDAENEGFYL